MWAFGPIFVLLMLKLLLCVVIVVSVDTKRVYKQGYEDVILSYYYYDHLFSFSKMVNTIKYHLQSFF